MNKRVKKPNSWFVEKLIEMGACSGAIRVRKEASDVSSGMAGVRQRILDALAVGKTGTR